MVCWKFLRYLKLVGGALDLLSALSACCRLLVGPPSLDILLFAINFIDNIRSFCGCMIIIYLNLIININNKILKQVTK